MFMIWSDWSWGRRDWFYKVEGWFGGFCVEISYITLIRRTCAHASHGELTGSLIATCILKITFAKHSLAFDTTALAT